MDKNLKKNIASWVILICCIAVVAVVSKYFPLLESLELKNYDFMMAVLRGPQPAPDDIAVVAIDEQSEDALEVTHPWPRSVHAALIGELNRLGAKAVVFDILFAGESDPEEDFALATAIRESRIPIIVTSTIEVVDDPRFSMVRELRPLEALTEAGALVGFATLNPDRDGTLRHGRLFVGGEPTLVTRTLEVLNLEPDFSHVPVAKYEGDDPEILVNYVGGSRSIPTVSYYQALDADNSLPQGFFKGRIVFVGYSLSVTDLSGGAAEDHYPSPYDGLSGIASMPGVEIHANIMNTLLRKKFIYPTEASAFWFMMLSLGLILSAIVLSNETFLVRMVSSTVIIFGYWVCATVVFLHARVWMYAVQPLIIMVAIFGLNVLYQYRLTERERAHIRRALSGYVSKQVMGEILKNPGQLELGGIQVEASVLFSDIAGFSKLSEKITPRELATLLNDYFTKMGDIIMGRDGMINKYIGDAVMAIWNAPLPNPAHAEMACRSALEMKRVVAGMAPLKMRIGINTGPMVAGNLGHRERMEYTVIGDAVNLASRLEGANKAFGTAIMISDSTEALVRSIFLLRRLDRIRVVGKQQPVAVFEVLAAMDDPPTPTELELVASFESIIDAYDDRNWEVAIARAKSHLEKFPDDLATQAYLKRCLHFQEVPPADEWDGVYTLEAK